MYNNNSLKDYALGILLIVVIAGGSLGFKYLYDNTVFGTLIDATSNVLEFIIIFGIAALVVMFLLTIIHNILKKIYGKNTD